MDEHPASDTSVDVDTPAPVDIKTPSEESSTPWRPNLWPQRNRFGRSTGGKSMHAPDTSQSSKGGRRPKGGKGGKGDKGGQSDKGAHDRMPRQWNQSEDFQSTAHSEEKRRKTMWVEKAKIAEPKVSKICVQWMAVLSKEASPMHKVELILTKKKGSDMNEVSESKGKGKDHEQTDAGDSQKVISRHNNKGVYYFDRVYLEPNVVHGVQYRDFGTEEFLTTGKIIKFPAAHRGKTHYTDLVSCLSCNSDFLDFSGIPAEQQDILKSAIARHAEYKMDLFRRVDSSYNTACIRRCMQEVEFSLGLHKFSREDCLQAFQSGLLGMGSRYLQELMCGLRETHFQVLCKTKGLMCKV